MQRYLLHFVLIQILFVSHLYSWRIFHRGRHYGGNLGLPGKSNEELSVLQVEDEWYTQLLDHFNPTDVRTWKQRFFTNEQYYNASSGGPVFLMIGGEGEASPEWMTKGTWIDYAQRFGALCFQLEHRFYGKSHPTKNLSTKNLQYLTSQQALADLATFIGAMNEKHSLPSDVKWITFGGSYPGSLAAWMRLKYPHLVHGSMSASGPLLAEVDFKDYFRVVYESLQTYSDACVNIIKIGTIDVEVVLRNRTGQLYINEKFRLCDPIEEVISNSNDIANFYETLASNFAGIVQYNKDNRLSNGAQKNITIDTVCDIMTNQKLGNPIDRLAAVNNLILNAYDQKCLDYKYDKMVDANRNVTWFSEVSEGGRQWLYQTCTEFGFFQTSSFLPQIFGDKFPVEFFIQQCVDIFGPKFNASFLNSGVERTNILYGGLDVTVSNVVFVQGSIDPWHALGITKTENQGAPAIYIEGTAHCANMYPKSNADLPQLQAAREQIGQLIDTWIRL